ncbi:hypothetical protein DLAC_09599 [Tieghemostelium lacteum]|uniref:HAM1-like N-terminal domain-containing protein n=1 Tax=Tieghemostelium lacteum TaxID=361077 RepID=A0A151Z769_TIELA|nr:hypothetical protein DLAC_09599 [Tieghemostelium lacteum]|eukprot:KYQ89634.1 hypothetical protein DLAC_09599 [Tieghemostelium lacteum]
MKIVDKVKTTVHSQGHRSGHAEKSGKKGIEYYENGNPSSSSSHPMTPTTNADLNRNRREKNIDEKAASVNVDKSKSGMDFRREYIATLNEQPVQQPILDENGLPVNVFSKAPTPVLLKRHLNSLERLMGTRIFRERADDNTKRVIYDLKNLLQDIIVICETRKTDLHIQQIIKDMKMFSGDLSSDKEMKILLEDWKATAMRLATGDQSKGLINSSTKLLGDLKNSECVLRFLSEGTKFLQMIVLNKDSALIDTQREIVFEEFFQVARLLSSNPAWNEFVLNSKVLGSDIRENEKIQSTSASKKLSSIQSNPSYNSLNSSFRILLQSFIKDKSIADVDKFFEYGTEASIELKKNPQYNQFLQDLQRITLELMEHPELVDDPSFRKAIRDLYSRGESLLVATKNNPALQRFTNEGVRLKDGIVTDELNSVFYTHLKQLTKDLNPPGKGSSKKLYGQLRMLLVPFLIEEFRTIPIPPTSGVTPDRKMGYRVANINLSAIELLPENIHFEISHKTNADPYTLSIIDPDTIVWVELTAIRARIEKIAWEYERFVFPKLHDSGLADVYMDGRGARVGVELRILGHGLERKTQVVDSYCSIENLNIRLYNCKHRILYKLVTRMLKKKLKFAIEKAVAQMVAKKIAEYDYKLVGKYNRSRDSRLRAKNKLNERIKALREKSKAKAAANPNAHKKANLSNFFKTVVGSKKSSSEQRMEIPTTTTTTTTTTKIVEEPIPLTKERVVTTTVPVETISNDQLPLTGQATQYVVNPNITQTTTTKTVEQFTKEKPSTGTPEMRPNYVGPSSN